jgi:hypothetical protein
MESESESDSDSDSEKVCYPRLRERGQVTIPEDVRDVLGAEAGDRLRLRVRLDEDGAGDGGEDEDGPRAPGEDSEL